MGEVILYGSEKADDEKYDWNAAFNNPEFISYLFMSSIYTNYQLEISDYEFISLPKKITAAVFPSCYKRIGSHAFEGCTNLNFISFPSDRYDNDEQGVVRYEIGEEAFIGCTNLSSFSINVTKKIGKRAFKNLSNLYEFTGSLCINGDPSSSYWMNYIDDEAFKNCTSLYLFNNMSIIYRIGKSAFENCTNLYWFYGGYIICNEIDDYAFKGCNNLAFISLNTFMSNYPYTRCKLGSYIFEGCTSLSSISIYGVIDSITSNTLGNLSSILNQIDLVVPRSFLGMVDQENMWFNIGAYTFQSYEKLSAAYISCVDTIGSHAFEDCSSLYYANAGYDLCKKIEDYAFAGCSKIPWLYMNNSAFSYINSASGKYPKMELSGSHIFDNCTSLSRINLWGCGNIPSYLFNNSNIPLNDITIGGLYGDSSLYNAMYYSVTIGEHAFDGCYSLSFVGGAFANIIETNAFRGCYSIQNFYFGSYLCKEIQSNAFTGCTNISYMSFNTSHSYIANASSIYLSIDSSAFVGCGVKNLTLIDVEYLGDGAFYGCSINHMILQAVSSANLSLTSIILDGLHTLEYLYISGITYIDDYAFNACANIGIIQSMYQCSYIGSHAFEGLSKLSIVSDLAYNASSLYIGEYAFADCYNLSSFYAGPTIIGPHAFENCNILNNILGPVRTISVGAYAFYNCTLFTAGNPIFVYVEYIGSHAFDGCTNLSSIYLAGISSVPFLESIDAFDNINEDYIITVPPDLYSEFINHSVWGLISSHISYNS